MTTLTLTNFLPALQAYIDEMLCWQILDEDHPDYGGLVNPDYGLADPHLASALMTACVYHALATGQPDPALFERANLAGEALLKALRPSGLIDLLSVNYDSSPDTGFLVQRLCTLIELGGEAARVQPRWVALLGTVEQIIRRGVSGMLDGGFHTPNHRWVMVSALTQAKTLFPDLEVKRTVEAYLAEGIDIDEEGTFIERSVGVYDAVNNRSLLFIGQNWDFPEAFAAVERSLTFDLHLLHADGTAETGLSRRQDYGTRTVPVGLIDCFLISHHLQPNPIFARAAQYLWDQLSSPRGDLLWVAYALLKGDDLEPSTASLPTDFAHYYPLNGIWRVRRERLSASFFKGVTRLLTLTYGQAELSSLKISQTYFGQFIGRFVGDSVTVDDVQGVLRSEGLANPRRPGYELPLGKLVPPDQWQAMLSEREIRRLPPATSTLTVREIVDGFELCYQTLAGLDKVAAQIAFDFPPGGIWESGDLRLKPEAGQTIFLKRGYGTMRYGHDVIMLGPGAFDHGMWQMREAEPAPDHVRILLTFRTPVDFTFKLRTFRGLKPPVE